MHISIPLCTDKLYCPVHRGGRVSQLIVSIEQSVPEVSRHREMHIIARIACILLWATLWIMACTHTLSIIDNGSIQGCWVKTCQEDNNMR